MENTTSDYQSHQPIPLLRNVRYPSYQLWAIAGSASNQENVLKIVVLHTMKWLRERLREHILPKELDFPTADAFEEVNFSQFSNIRLKQGYQLEVVWLSEEKSWSLQLTEPDLGPFPGQQDQGRPPVAGRIFETNISYQMTSRGVLCGFQTMVSEPERTAEPCEVFRLAVIKQLKRDPLVGLHQVWQLEEKPHSIQSSADVKNFCKRVMKKERTLPVVVVAEYLPPSEKQNEQKKTSPIFENLETRLNRTLGFEDIEATFRNRFFNTERHLREVKDVSISQKSDPILPSWLNDISHYRMGYAHFFVVAAECRDEFNRASGYALSNGGVLFIPPPQIDERETVFSCEEVSGESFFYKIDNMVAIYLREKQFDFTSCCFVPQAQEKHMEKILQNKHTETELKKYYAERLAQTEERHGKHLSEMEGANRREVRKLEQGLEKECGRKTALENQIAQLQAKLEQEKLETKNLTHRLQMLRIRPSKSSSVCDWVELTFGSRVMIHERVRRTMKDIQSSEVDIDLLYDAIEYLAYEHWDELNSVIDNAECRRRCSLYYNRPFEVCRNSDSSIQRYPEDYIIPYKKNGRDVDTHLLWHLKIGTDSKNLLRIYFFYCKENRKIVIGSMPNHLRIVDY
ncbi:MAG: hypothetical protein FWG31_03685 [Oscillospiraceae bacterium]|nr:hypothetical protein [Oscillospiraceae bacterium]